MSTPNFSLGNLVATPNATRLLEKHHANTQDFLQRPQQGDWGEVDEEDAVMNDFAVENDERIFSAHPLGSDTIWLIIERDRSVTTTLMPEDY